MQDIKCSPLTEQPWRFATCVFQERLQDVQGFNFLVYVGMFVWVDMCFGRSMNLSQRGRVGRVIMCTRLKTHVNRD